MSSEITPINKKLAIISGNGNLPLSILESAVSNGWNGVVIDIADNQSNNTVEVKINRIEDFGNYKLITAKMGKFTIKSKVNRETEVPAHNVKLHIPAEKCCVYENNKLI